MLISSESRRVKSRLQRSLEQRAAPYFVSANDERIISYFPDYLNARSGTTMPFAECAIALNDLCLQQRR